jgi:hypothetical protein
MRLDLIHMVAEEQYITEGKNTKRIVYIVSNSINTVTTRLCREETVQWTKMTITSLIGMANFE